MDIIVMDQINVSFVQHHVQSVKIIIMIVQNDINYKCECEFGFFSVDPQKVKNVKVHVKLVNQIRIIVYHALILIKQQLVCINAYVTQVRFLIQMVSHVSSVNYHVIVVQIQSINVQDVKIKYINNLNLVNVNMDGYLMIITSAYLVQNHMLIKNQIIYHNAFANLLIILIIQQHVQSVNHLVLNVIQMDVSNEQISIKSQIPINSVFVNLDISNKILFVFNAKILALHVLIMLINVQHAWIQIKQSKIINVSVKKGLNKKEIFVVINNVQIIKEIIVIIVLYLSKLRYMLLWILSIGLEM
ncbi:unnamed protein product [Paramecium sonneborni]|uniref:Transmembrane protein n=1 Tax=Paramecium sonneborni TaxID=65129 RepID=A0A8S1RVB1_9CILI|nr:unnamed protein product [Paramecium sonneborni]